jgi:predicted dehydrogenase
MKPLDPPINRREFLSASATSAAGVAAGVVGWPEARADSATAVLPSQRVRLGVIGLRSQGKVLARALASLPDAEVTALCDIDQGLFGSAVQAVEELQSPPPRCETDFRRLLDDPAIDAVVVATPDHWHALMAMLACQHGKDVYIETPVAHTIAEGQAMLAVAQQTKRIVYPGLSQRSGEHFISAVDSVRSGAIGKVHLARAWTVHQRKSIGFKREAPVPEGVDYDLWLGPAPRTAFHPNRFHHNWHWFWDYGSGELGHWGVQLLDLARWGLGVDLPNRVSAAGGKHYFRDDQETPDTLFVNYEYAGKTITWEHRLWGGHAPEGRSAAVAFCGDLGTLIVDRGGWKIYGRKDSKAAGSSELLEPHLRGFLKAVRSRTLPACDLETGCISSALCHLGNAAYRAGKTLSVDPRLALPADPATKLLAQIEYRGPWDRLFASASAAANV